METSKTRKVYDKLINEMYSFLYHKSIQSSNKLEGIPEEGGRPASNNTEAVCSNGYCYKKIIDSTGNTRQFVSKLKNHMKSGDASNAEHISNVDSENIHTKENYYNVRAKIEKDKDDYAILKKKRASSFQVLDRTSKVMFSTSQLSPPIHKL